MVDYEPSHLEKAFVILETSAVLDTPEATVSIIVQD